MDNKNILSEILKKKPTGVIDVEFKPVTTTVETSITRSDENRNRVETPVTSVSEDVASKIVLKKPMSYVTVEMGGNFNLGNYNMGRVKVSISVPSGVEIDDEYKKQVNDAYLFGQKFCESRVEEEISKLMKLTK